MPDDPPDDVYRDHVGIHPQRRPDYGYVGLPIVRGRMTPGAAAGGGGAGRPLRLRRGPRPRTCRTSSCSTCRRERAGRLAREVEAAGLRLDGSPFRRGTVACTGTEFCKLALTETKGFARWLVEELEGRLPGFDQHVRLHVTGCPNSLRPALDRRHRPRGQEAQGRRRSSSTPTTSASAARSAGTRRWPGPSATAWRRAEVPAAIERLLRAYLDERARRRELPAIHRPSHRRGAARVSSPGERVAAVERDVPAGRPPRGVDG